MVVVYTVVVEIRVIVEAGKVVDTVVVYRGIQSQYHVITTQCSVPGVLYSHKQKVISTPRTRCRTQGTVRKGKKVLPHVRT